MTETGTYIMFVPGKPKPKTLTWFVLAKDGDAQLGSVMWHGPWRKYAFFPEYRTLFETLCLREIASFCEAKTNQHNQNRRTHEQRTSTEGPAA